MVPKLVITSKDINLLNDILYTGPIQNLSKGACTLDTGKSGKVRGMAC